MPDVQLRLGIRQTAARTRLARSRRRARLPPRFSRIGFGHTNQVAERFGRRQGQTRRHPDRNRPQRGQNRCRHRHRHQFRPAQRSRKRRLRPSPFPQRAACPRRNRRTLHSRLNAVGQIVGRTQCRPDAIRARRVRPLPRRIPNRPPRPRQTRPAPARRADRKRRHRT